MALKPCRECGQQVSTEAATCPHCGVSDPTGAAREAARKKSEKDTKETQGCLGCAGIGIVGVFVVMIISTLTGDDSAGPSSGGPSSAPAVQELNASVRKSALQVEVTNRSAQGWTNCKVDLNPGIIRGGWAQRIASIPAGQTVNGGLLAFTKPDGERFNPAEYVLKSVRVSCDQGFWSGEFAP